MSASSQLLERCLAGDPGSIEAVFQTYRRPVYRLAYAALLDGDLAGRAMQAGLNSVLGALRTGMTDEDFLRLLYQHVLRACRRERLLTWLERLLPWRKPAQVQSAAAPHTFHDAITRRKTLLWQAICALPEDQRVALTLRYEFELPLPGVARILRSSPGAVHARLSAARRKLGVELESILESEHGAGRGTPLHGTGGPA